MRLIVFFSKAARYDAFYTQVFKLSKKIFNIVRFFSYIDDKISEYLMFSIVLVLIRINWLVFLLKRTDFHNPNSKLKTRFICNGCACFVLTYRLVKYGSFRFVPVIVCSWVFRRFWTYACVQKPFLRPYG